MFEEIEQRIESLGEYVNLVDRLYLILYIIILVDAILLSLGYQDVILTTVPQFDISYIISNIIIAVVSFVAIILILLRKRSLAYFYANFLAIFFAMWTIIEGYVLLFNTIEGGIIFRMSFNIFITVMLFFRTKFLNIDIKEGL